MLHFEFKFKLFCVVALLSIMSFTNGICASPVVQRKIWAGAKSLKAKEISYSKHYKFYDKDVSYHQFTGEPSEAVSKVNSAIQSVVAKEMDDLNRAMSNEEGESKDSYCACGDTVVYATSQFVSVRFEFECSSGGSSRPTHYIRTLNYQLDPFRKLTLPDLIGSKATYKLISDMCRTRLTKEFEEDQLTAEGVDRGVSTDMLENGIKPVMKNFEAFTFDKDGIQINFQPYQVAPRSEGEPVVDLSYRELQPLITNSSPIANLAKAWSKIKTQPTRTCNSPAAMEAYIVDLKRRIKEHWFPPKGNEKQQLVALFTINKGGEISNLHLTKSSEISAVNKAALKAIKDAAPFAPFPLSCKEKLVDIEFTFDYNVFRGINPK